MTVAPRGTMRFQETSRILSAAEKIEPKLGGPAGCAVILGSGFSSLLDLLEDSRAVSFTDIEGLPGCTAPGHAGRIAGGTLDGKRCLMVSGRLHLYEALSAEEVTVPVALARALGADRIILTCAAGAVGRTLPPGSLVLVEDHINLTGANPLIAVPVHERRPIFLPLGDAYDRTGLDVAARLAGTLTGGYARGVLAGLPGPCYETPAEYRALERLGADIVSMSCVLETIAARSLGMKVLALSIVANGPARIGERSIDGAHVLEVVETAVQDRRDFFRSLISEYASMSG